MKKKCPKPRKHEDKEIKILKNIEKVERRIEKDVRRLKPRKAKSALLTFKGDHMPASIAVGKTATAVFTEFDGPNGTGNVLTPIGAVTFASDNSAVATVDPTSGIATGVSAGTANISASDAGNSISASDVLTVTGNLAQSATVVLTAN